MSTKPSNARTELLDRLDTGAWAEDVLIHDVVSETPLEEHEVEQALIRLDKHGQIYSFNGVVKRT